ncbi:hypothetical protein GCM10023203_10160 [Actinomycetospora straminea]|uniref:Uncharacterized protein n=2 Tax=Actinomycetospora straminea TaxID=663607 RepID=A0ABP9E015_9PSEU
MVFSTRRLLLAGLLVVGAVIWVRINKPVEGEVLLELSRRHGVTTADLLSLVMLAMAVVIAWPSWRAPESRPERRPAADDRWQSTPFGGPAQAPPPPAPPTRRDDARWSPPSPTPRR